MKISIQLAARACLIILLFALFVGGSLPGSGHLFTPPWDKVAHCIFYGGMLLIARLAFPKQALYLLFLFVMGVGVLDEIHQMFVVGRSPGVDDLIADLVGCLIMFTLIKFAAPTLQNNH